MKKNLIKCLMIFAFVFTSCTTNKKIESDDEFAVEGSASVGSDEIGGSTDADLGLSEFDEKPAEADKGTANKTEDIAANSDASIENELNSLGDTTVQDSATNNDELTLDDPVKGELSLDEPAAAPLEKPADTVTEQQSLPAEKLTEPAPPPPVDIAETTPAVPTEIPPPQEPLPVVESSKLATIDNVTYQANSNGGTIAVTADQPLKFTTRLNSTTNQFIVEVENSTIPKKLKRSLNTKDMASTIGSVDIYQKTGSNVARFVVQLREGAPEPIVQPEGNSILIIGSGTAAAQAAAQANASAGGDVSTHTGNNSADSAAASAASPTNVKRSNINNKSLSTPNDEVVDLATPGIMSSDDLEEFLISNNKFYGNKISIETNNMDIKDALKFISEESGVNIIIDESVSGKVSLKLRNIPWDQALILLLKTKGLGFKRQGSVLRIGKIDEFMAEEREALEMKEARKVRSPFVVKRFFIGYAEIKDLEAKIKTYLATLANVQTTGAATPTGAAQGVAIRQKENVGTVLGDVRTNSLIVTDTEKNMIKITKLIEALDTQPQQVLIEGKVVEAKEEFTRGLGVNWSTLPTAGSTNTARIGITPTVDSANAVFDGAFTWGQLDILGSLTARLALGEREDRVRVLSSPRIAVLSNVKATISQTAGFLIPRSSTSTPGSATVTTTNDVIPVGVTLDVKPLVSNEGTVTMELNITRSFVARIDAKAPEERKASTQVIVKSGQTAVIGGIFESSTTIGKSGVPGFRDLPILGTLFQSESENKSKNELIIFVTPTILKPVVGTEKKTSEIQ